MLHAKSASSAAPLKFIWMLLACALLLAARSPRGQAQSRADDENKAPSPIKVDVKVVNVLATVRDKKDAIVSTLGKDDFLLDEDGRPQMITYFAKDTDLPLTVGLLVDTSESQRRVLDQERSASRSFLDDMLRPDKDRAFVVHFDREVELLQDVTASRDKLSTALDLLEPSRPEFSNQGSSGGGNSGGNGSGNGGRRGGGRQFGGGAGTLLHDAVFLASDEVIKKQDGRKALIVLSDGVDHGSKETLESAIMTAQRADTIVYSILFSDEQTNRSPFGFGGPGFGRGGGRRRFPQQQEDRTDGKKILERISKETGGRLFEVSKKEPIDEIYKTIAEELRNQYSIGYTPAADDAPGYHTIHLTAKPKDLTVQARSGYYSNR